MFVLDVKSIGNWSDAAINRSEMVSSYCSVSTTLLAQSGALPRLEAESTFTILQAFRLRTFVRSGFDFPDFGVAAA